MSIKATLLLTAAIEAVNKGTQLLTVLDNLATVRDRMKAADRVDPTDEELNMVRGRIADRQERINRA